MSHIIASVEGTRKNSEKRICAAKHVTLRAHTIDHMAEMIYHRDGSGALEIREYCIADGPGELIDRIEFGPDAIRRGVGVPADCHECMNGIDVVPRGA